MGWVLRGVCMFVFIQIIQGQTTDGNKVEETTFLKETAPKVAEARVDLRRDAEATGSKNSRSGYLDEFDTKNADAALLLSLPLDGQVKLANQGTSDNLSLLGNQQTANLLSPNPYYQSYPTKSSNVGVLNPYSQISSLNNPNSGLVQNNLPYYSIYGNKNPYDPIGPTPNLYTKYSKTKHNGYPETHQPALFEAGTHRTGLPSVGPSTNLLACATSRLISPNEYVLPSQFPGGENIIRCSAENEFHHLWSRGLDCLICVCVNQFDILAPVCASCAGCANPPAPDVIPYTPFPPSRPTAEPIVTLTPITLPPPPDSSVTCSPLPSNTPFTNPLHPCQICICHETINSLGNVDIQIECMANPQCVVPSDVTVLPLIPDSPIPTPLPLCEKFPLNVYFPHPTDMCKTCKCSRQDNQQGTEAVISCFTSPECDSPTEEPVYPIPLTTLPPYNDVTVEPIPWPPATIIPVTPTPVRPGPLPGPSPHESCRPYPANQAFLHPWDECLICVCYEAFAVGKIDVEVYCFTKPSCCIEVPSGLAAPGLVTPGLGPLGTGATGIGAAGITATGFGAPVTQNKFRIKGQSPITPGNPSYTSSGLGYGVGVPQTLPNYFLQTQYITERPPPARGITINAGQERFNYQKPLNGELNSLNSQYTSNYGGYNRGTYGQYGQTPYYTQYRYPSGQDYTRFDSDLQGGYQGTRYSNQYQTRQEYPLSEYLKYARPATPRYSPFPVQYGGNLYGNNFNQNQGWAKTNTLKQADSDDSESEDVSM